jgi:hypothetical protein
MLVMIGKNYAVDPNFVRSIEVSGDLVIVRNVSFSTPDIKEIKFDSEEEAQAAVSSVFLQAAAVHNSDIEFAGNMASLAGFDVESSVEIHEISDEDGDDETEVIPVTDEQFDRFAAEARGGPKQSAPTPEA